MSWGGGGETLQTFILCPGLKHYTAFCGQIYISHCWISKTLKRLLAVCVTQPVKGVMTLSAVMCCPYD